MHRRTPSERESETDDGGLPPVVRCALCGRFDCLGCEPARLDRARGPTLPWEDSGGWGERLWRTALVSSTEPLRTFGELPEGRVGPALAFAFLSEMFAIGSLGVLGALSGLAAAPHLCLRILSDPVGLGVAGGAIPVLSAGMVVLHTLWGICIELGAAATGGTARWRLGIRFGLYACGWDFLTSPAGVLRAVASRGLADAWGPVGAAIQVPRAAMQAYTEQRRRLDRRARRRAVQLSVAVLGCSMLVVGVGLFAAFFFFAPSIGRLRAGL